MATLEEGYDDACADEARVKWEDIPMGEDHDESAGWVFKANSKQKDYHKNFNGEMFMTWVNRFLLPTFKKKYPGKKMLLTLDNAPYNP